MGPTLRAAIDAAYQAFGRYGVGPQLEVCSCCVSESAVAALVATPLRELPAELLCEFTDSAHGEGRVEEVKYFLPRYFELLAQGEETSHIGVSLKRLGECDWLSWPRDEALVV